ncbi:MAG: dihydroorotate dehydrogenase [Candidatus Omnitrophica bacterium]|nr:dihydroorotate dehydrogenase [Candidatus Omnitrophota bacterium]
MKKINTNNALEIDIGGLKLANPVMTASGTFGYTQECRELISVSELGAVITKSITLQPSPGNRPPRLWETTAGLLNAIGIQNEGLDDFVHSKLPLLKSAGTRIVASIAGVCRQDYEALAKALDATDVDAIEVNISCPNIEHKSPTTLFAQDPYTTSCIIRSVKKQTDKPVIAKLSPNVTDIGLIARAAEKAGADAVSMINTLIGMDVDIARGKPRLGNITGGLSGPAIKPVALAMVWQAYHRVKIPIIGIGGIMSTEDAIAFFLCGASAVQIGTANFVDPAAASNIIRGLRLYLKNRGMKNIRELIGQLKV